jgi:hypothetical protein
MHLRYDLKNKLDLSNFEKQSYFFLNKEDCIFSFYLTDFAISFNVARKESEGCLVGISLSELSEINQNGDIFYKNIDPLHDPRFKEISFITEMFVSGSPGTCTKSSKQETINYILFMIKAMSKINKLALIA